MSAHQLSALAGLVLLGIAAAHAAITLLATCVWHLRARRTRAPASRPGITVLKPLCGSEPELYENLCSFCRQDYPQYQIVFGVREATDSALAAVARLRHEFPPLDIELVIEQAQCGSNRKVSNLMNMLPLARHEVLFIADSDTRVRPDYLSQLVGRLLAPRVGLVTCLYRCIPAGGLWSRLGAMYINDWYMPSVMLARLFGHRRYVSGQTIALRRATLEAAGGLRMLVNHLADDYELGERVRALGLKTVLSHYAAETVQAEGSLGSLIGHELRWMRTLRALAPAAFGFLFVSFTLPLAALGYVLAAGRFPLAAATLAGLTLGARILVTSVPRLQQRRIPWSDVLLLPVRDLLLCWTWSQALFSSRVRWRGGEFEIDRHGVMRTLP